MELKISKKASTGRVIGGVVAGASAIIGVIIIDQLLNATTFSSAIATTVKPYFVPLLIIAALSVAVAGWLGRR